MTGISPILTQAGAPATAGSLVSPAAVALQLPKPYVKPLPPLPQVPSIAEYYRKSAAPRILPVSVPQTLPRLEVLPLVPGTVPQVQSLVSTPLLLLFDWTLKACSHRLCLVIILGCGLFFVEQCLLTVGRCMLCVQQSQTCFASNSPKLISLFLEDDLQYRRPAAGAAVSREFCRSPADARQLTAGCTSCCPQASQRQH